MLPTTTAVQGAAMAAGDFMPGEAVLAVIRKNIEAYEAERLSAYRQVRWRVPLFVSLVVAAVLGLAWAFNALADPYEQWLSTPHLLLYVVGLVAALVAYFLGMRPAHTARQSFRERLLPIAFSFIDDVRYRNGVEPDSFGRLPRDTVGAFNRETFDDVVSGRYQGFPFELYEARLVQKSGKTSRTTFNGVIMAIGAAVAFPGTLLATRKANTVFGFFRTLFGSRLETIESGVPALDQAYEFRTDNAEAARPLVAGRLAKALQWLGEAWPEEPARIALSHSDIFLLLPQDRNFFELPGVSKPLDYNAHVKPIIADMAALLATAALVRQVGASDEGAPE
jgi:hypothetical protein